MIRFSGPWEPEAYSLLAKSYRSSQGSGFGLAAAGFWGFLLQAVDFMFMALGSHIHQPNLSHCQCTPKLSTTCPQLCSRVRIGLGRKARVWGYRVWCVGLGFRVLLPRTDRPTLYHNCITSSKPVNTQTTPSTKPLCRPKLNLSQTWFGHYCTQDPGISVFSLSP